jgi:uncharacterized protein YodC (DUF2158 family)
MSEWIDDDSNKNQAPQNTERAFKPGDVVRLKSGGPNMTIRKVGEHSGDSVECCWFTKDDEDKWGLFKECALKPIPPGQSLETKGWDERT